MKERIRVGILMGGKSGERDVSIASGCYLAEILDRTRYEVHPIEIGVDGKWYLHHMDSPLLASGSTIGIQPSDPDEYSPPSPEVSELVTARVMRSRIDVIFPALHGPGGEDGSIQGYLETLEIPYVGSGVLASALTMDKARCKVFLRASGLPTPEWLSITREEWEKNTNDRIETILSLFPGGSVVKPNQMGSSIGVSLVAPDEDPGPAIDRAFEHDRVVLVEERIPGRELTCGVYGSENPEVLPVTEIRPVHEFFNYEAKYQLEGAEEITPADLSEPLYREIQSLATQTHRVFGCAGISRTDFMLSGEKPFIIEINAIPGLTRVSTIPRACAAIGMDFEVILDRVIGEALFRDQMVPVA